MKMLTFSLLIIASSLLGNGIGVSPIEFFKGAGGESFKSNLIVEDSKGNVYTGFEEGVKIFKGGVWEDFFITEKDVKHILPLESGKFLVGGDRYFSLLEADSLGRVSIDEISRKLSDEVGFDILQSIIPYSSGSFLHLDNRIIKLDDQITDYNLSDVTYAASFNQNVIIQRLNKGLYIYAGNDFRKINASDAFANVEVSEIVDLQDGTFLILYEGKVAYYDGDNFRNLAITGLDGVGINSAACGENDLFLCTEDQRILQIDIDTWDPIRSTIFDGYCNALYSDVDNNIWISSNDGVAILKPESPFLLIPFGDEEGRACKLVESQLFLGTNRGTYTTAVDRFNSLGGYENMSQVNNDYVNHINTAFGKPLVAAKNNIDFGRGVNQLFYLDEGGVLLKADKSGLGFYQNTYGKWVFANHIYGFEEEVFQILRDNVGSIWVHGARSGIAKLNYDHVLNTINPKRYQVSNLQNEAINGIFLINGLPFVSTQKGLYKYQAESESFETSKEYNKLLGSENDIKYIYQDNDEDIWYISEEECGLLKIEDKGLVKTVQKLRIPELQLYVNLNKPGILSLNGRDIVINGRDGFILVDKTKITNELELSLGIYSLQIPSSKQTFLFVPKQREIQRLKMNYGKLRVSLFSNQDHFKDQVFYAYKLNENEWTNWSDENTIDLDLDGGRNKVILRAKTGLNTVSSPYIQEFFLIQKWYKQNWFYYFLGVLGLLAGMILLYFVRRLLKRRKFRITTLMQENRDQKRQIRELTEKNEVLGSQLISAISDSGIEQKLKKIGDEYENLEVKKVVKKLSKKIKTDRKETERLIVVDPEFTSRLKLRFPRLTKKDIRLCTMLKMDLTTKEIAPVLDISVRGVEISRYRLRKKLEIGNEVSLADFLKKV